MSDSEDSDDVFAVAPQMHAFSDSGKLLSDPLGRE
jgi:hypothetical protein